MSNAVLVINSVSSTDSCDRDVLVGRVNRAIDMVNALEINGWRHWHRHRLESLAQGTGPGIIWHYDVCTDPEAEAKPRGRKPKANAPVNEAPVVAKPRGRKRKAPIPEKLAPVKAKRAKTNVPKGAKATKKSD